MLTQLRSWIASKLHLSLTQPWPRHLLSGDTAAGMSVNEETALRYTAVFACVRVLSESIAGLPLHLYRRDGDARERATDHPLYSVLHNAPNAYMTSFEYRRLAMTHLLLWGNSYSEVVRDEAGNVTELLPLHPGRMNLKTENGAPVYEFTPPNGPKVTLPFARVLHLRGLSTDGWMGLSPIAAARQSIGLSLSCERFGAEYFGKGTRIGGILNLKYRCKDQTERDRIRAEWNAGNTGVDSFHRIAVVDGGDLEWQPFSIDNESAQFLESRRFGIEDIARIYRVPPHKIADLSKANYSNVDAMERAFANDSLMPWTVNVEQAMSAKLLGPRQRQTYFIEHDLNGLLRGDHEARMRAYQAGIYSGIYSPNEARKAENLPPREGGDVFLQPTNTAPSPYYPQQNGVPQQ